MLLQMRQRQIFGGMAATASIVEPFGFAQGPPIGRAASSDYSRLRRRPKTEQRLSQFGTPPQGGVVAFC
jgi:hypothetical protein